MKEEIDETKSVYLSHVLKQFSFCNINMKRKRDLTPFVGMDADKIIIYENVAQNTFE